jgi:hypothetical protein
MTMRNIPFSISVWLLAGALFFSLGLAPAGAFDEQKCKSNVTKLLKLVKPYKGERFKDLMKEIDALDEVEGGMDPEVLEEAVEVPFEDLAWSKKFAKYMDKVEKYCAK